MPRPNRTKQLPYLTEYIRYAVNWRPTGWNAEVSGLTIGFGVGISLFIGLIVAAATRISFAGDSALTIASFAVYMLGAYGMSLKRSPREPDSQVQLRREAKQVAKRLEACLEKKRLHRDLSIEVSTVLEEAARNWHRAKAALDSPYWRRADLPPHLRSVREQSLLAIDQGIQELLVLFATSVPAKPGHWTISEVVDEVVGQDFLTTKGRLDHISPFYDEGRNVAGKLYEMADQVEAVSRRLAGEELIAGAPKPGSALEATLAELRQIKQAEDELQQDIRA